MEQIPPQMKYMHNNFYGGIIYETAGSNCGFQLGYCYCDEFRDAVCQAGIQLERFMMPEHRLLSAQAAEAQILAMQAR